MNRPGSRTASGLAFGLLALAVAAGLVAARLARGGRAGGPLPEEGYVWQRALAADTVTAAQRAGLAGVVVLAAEADLARQPPRVTEVAMPAAPAAPADRARAAAPADRARAADSSDSSPMADAAAAAGGPAEPTIGVALRIGPLRSSFAAAPEAARLALALARRAVARARAVGWRVSELQVDFDCATARLDDYAQLVLRLRQAVAPVPVTVTALPSWLARPGGFANLLAAADRLVLQLHSLERPKGPDVPLVLCDPQAAMAAVEAAARFRKPFRVALPTYGLVVAFSREGHFLGLAAEGPALRWPAGTRLRATRSDPAAMAALIQGWQRDRPRELAGILWYRLPASGDRLNWGWPTLGAVMAGRPPRASITVAVRRQTAAAGTATTATTAARPATATAAGLSASTAGMAATATTPSTATAVTADGGAAGRGAPASPPVAEIEAVNAGEAPGPWPETIRILWNRNRLLAADGTAGYVARPAGPRELRLTRAPSAAFGVAADELAPGEHRTLGWLRFDHPTILSIETHDARPP